MILGKTQLYPVAEYLLHSIAQRQDTVLLRAVVPPCTAVLPHLSPSKLESIYAAISEYLHINIINICMNFITKNLNKMTIICPICFDLLWILQFP